MQAEGRGYVKSGTPHSLGLRVGFIGVYDTGSWVLGSVVELDYTFVLHGS